MCDKMFVSLSCFQFNVKKVSVEEENVVQKNKNIVSLPLRAKRQRDSGQESRLVAHTVSVLTEVCELEHS